MDKKEILSLLPYETPFLFVDELLEVHQDGAKGVFTFKENLGFYTGHFKDKPITPGVILTECCAQIGLVCLGIYLLKDESLSPKNIQIGISSSEMEFLKPVFPGEKVTVVSDKIYYRFHKLKCKVKMFDAQNNLICKGILAGMLKVKTDE